MTTSSQQSPFYPERTTVGLLTVTITAEQYRRAGNMIQCRHLTQEVFDTTGIPAKVNPITGEIKLKHGHLESDATGERTVFEWRAAPKAEHHGNVAAR